MHVLHAAAHVLLLDEWRSIAALLDGKILRIPGQADACVTVLETMVRNCSLVIACDAHVGFDEVCELALTGMISREGEVDLAETIVRLNEVQYAYQAALQSGAKIMNSSLMNYLR